MRQELVTAMEDSGRAVILHGPPGSGRVTLARTLLAPARQGGVGIAIADAADPDEPAWDQIAHQFTARRRALRAIGRSISGWIGLIPIVGGVAEALVETVQTVRGRSRGSDAAASRGTGSTIDQVRLLLSEAPMEPRLIILENLEASDADEMAGAFALVQRIHGTRTLFVGTSTSTGGRLPDNVAKLRHEILREDTGTDLQIPPLPPDDCVRAVQEATGAPVPPAWREWVTARAPRTPERLWEMLGALAADGVLTPEANADSASWQWTRGPEPRDDALIAIRDEEMVGLSDQEREILETASRIGTRFPVPELAGRLAMPELTLQEHLDRLTRRGRIQFDTTEEDGGELVDYYRFPDSRTAASWAARPDPTSDGPADLG